MENLCATFKLFGLSHIVYLLLSIAVIAVLVMTLRKSDKKVVFYASKTMVGLCILFVILEMVGKISAGNGIFESLPINPWNIFAIICLIVEIKQSESWIKFNYLIALPVSLVSLFIIPNYFTTISAANIATISYFMINMILASYSLLKLFCLTNWSILLSKWRYD